MYWIFLVIFIITVLIPDIIRGDVYFLSEERVEEVAIFLMGAIMFLLVIRNELLLALHIRKREESEKKVNQTVKDLVESYSYIGEVNRKMDMLMNIALGISDRSLLNKKREREIYDAIVSAANFLMKAECTSLRFVSLLTRKTEKEIKSTGKQRNIKNSALITLKEKDRTAKISNCLVVSSFQEINNIRVYIVISGYDREEESNPKNLEILKVFASQAIFLYSYMNQTREDKVKKGNGHP